MKGAGEVQMLLWHGSKICFTASLWPYSWDQSLVFREGLISFILVLLLLLCFDVFVFHQSSYLHVS